MTTSAGARLPRAAEMGYKALQSLPEERFSALIRVLSQAQQHLDGENLLATVEIATSLDRSQARLLLYSMMRLLEPDSSTPWALDALVETIAPTEIGAAASPDSEAFRNRLVAVSQCRALTSFAKATQLLLRNERNFISAATITDLRPAFAENLEEQPLAYVIQHQLQIRYRDEADAGTYKSFFVALDEPDLNDLMAALERCKAKARSLKVQLEQAHMSYLTTNRRA